MGMKVSSGHSAQFAEQDSSVIVATHRSLCHINVLFLRSHCVLNEQATNGCAIINEEQSTVVDLFLMAFPIMQTITAITKLSKTASCIAHLLCTAPAFSRSPRSVSGCTVSGGGSNLGEKGKGKYNGTWIT